MGDKDKVAPCFFFYDFAEQLLFLRLEIILFTKRAIISGGYQILGFMKTDGGNAADFRNTYLKQSQFFFIIGLKIGKAALYHGGFHPADIPETADISHFKIHTGILIQVPCRIMLFRPENRSDFKYSFIHPYHHLFIELGTLGQVCILSEIIQPEDIRSPFCALVHNFRRMDLGKFFLFQKSTESAAQAFLYFENCSLLFIPQGEGAVIQQCFQGCINPFSVNHHGHFLLRCGKYRDFGQVKLPAGFGTGLFHHQGPGPYAGFFF